MIQDTLRQILTGYVQARQQQPFPGEFHSVFRRLREQIAALPVIRSDSNLKVRTGFGIGEWARAPWVCVMDPRASRAPGEGVLIDITFRPDMAGFYLALSNGQTRDIATLKRQRAYEKWRNVAAQVLQSSREDLSAAGFESRGSPTLGFDDRRKEEDSHASTIAWRYYSVDSVPNAGELNEKVGVLLRVYRTWLAQYPQTEEPFVDDALDQMRRLFLARMPGFHSFTEPGPTYPHHERAYKDDLAVAFRTEVLPLFEPSAIQNLPGAEAAIQALYELLMRRRVGPTQSIQNLVGWRDTDHLRKLRGSDAMRAAQLYADLLHSTEETPHRVEEFSSGYMPILARHMPSGRQGVTRSLPTLLLMLADPDKDIFIRTSLFDRASQRLLGHPLLSGDPLTEGDYTAALHFAQRLRQELSNWGWQPIDMIDVQSFLWVADPDNYQGQQEGNHPEPSSSNPFEEATDPASERRVYKIAPGEQAAFWDECRAGGYICVGWDDVGDLRDIATDSDGFVGIFRDAMGDLYVGSPAKLAAGTKIAKALWSLRDVQPGDIIMATRGVRELLALGEVVEPGYEFDDTRARYKHLVRVRWDESYRRPLAGLLDAGTAKLWMSTIVPVERDLYAAILKGQQLNPETHDEYIEPPFTSIVAAIRNSGMRLSERMIRRYHAAVKTRGFVILAGASGTGKTWLAETYADAIGAHFLTVRVAPNWNSNEDLLGYLSPITGDYQHTRFSRFLIEADKAFRSAISPDAARPFHVLLDEMNLARVEHYFADFLSALEQRNRHGTATLSFGGEEVTLNRNLVFIGTVNMDETTHGFANKVYDRAQLLEVELDPELFAGHVAQMPFAEELKQIREAVERVAPIAFRTADDIAAYVAAATRIEPDWRIAFDEALVQKVLPRIRGIDPAVGEALRRIVDITEERYPLTHKRAQRMLEDYRRGAASFF